MLSGISFVSMRNKKGCNTNPSGTPEMISVDSEVWPFEGTLM